MTMIRSGRAFLMAVCLISLTAFAQGETVGPIIWFGQSFDPDNVPVYSSRLFRVPDETQGAALELLGNKDFLPLSMQQLSSLFPHRHFEVQDMLAAQASVRRHGNLTP